MKFDFFVSIGYRDIFDDYESADIKVLIADIPTINSLEIIAYFLAQLHTAERDPFLQIEFLRAWVDRLPESIHDKINDFIIRITAKSRTEYNFLNNVSALILIEILIENANILDRLDNLTPAQELNLFKAYLICSQKWIDKQLTNTIVGKIANEEDLVKILIPTQLPFQEILELKDFRLQIIKAIYFFKFCESDDQFKDYLQIFLKEYNLDTWQRYLFNLITLYTRKFEKLKTPFWVYVPNEFPDATSFLQLLTVDTNSFVKSEDFLNLREKPIYRVDYNNFIILNLNFLVDKLYQGIQFDLARVLFKNSATFKGKKIKSTVDFMGIFGEYFSETGLFYSVMEYAFEHSTYKKLKGSEIKEYISDGEPDFYMRDKSKIYLFEFKNIYISSITKNSYNYEQIHSEIFKKLVANQEGSPKGVTQLVNSIIKLRKGEFNKIDNYDFENTTIYPIIVYVDFSFNLSGMNYILNREFQKQIKSNNIENIENIKDLILIDLDTFIKFQDLFRNKILRINNCLNEYSNFTKTSKDLFVKLTTFNIFIHYKTRKLNYDSPKMLHDEVLKMIQHVQNK